MGMLAGRSGRGLQSQIKKEANEEAKRMAKKTADEGRLEEAARSLIGPRGGLPTLRADLLRLCALLRVQVEDWDTVDRLKEKARPVVRTLMDRRGPIGLKFKHGTQGDAQRPRHSFQSQSAAYVAIPGDGGGRRHGMAIGG